MRTLAIFSCAALFFTPLTADAQLRRAGAPGYGVIGNPVGAPGIPAAGEPGYGDADNPGYGDADNPGYGLVGNPIGALGIPEDGPDVNLGGPINRRGLR